MKGFKYLLVLRNDLLETCNNIFPEMVKNVYCEVLLLDLYKNHLKSDIQKLYSEITFSLGEIELDPSNKIILQLISGKFIFFNSYGTGGSCFGEYKNEFEIYSPEKEY